MRIVLLPLLGAVCFSGSFAAPDYCAISPQNTLCLYSACTFSSTCNRPIPVAVTAEDKETVVSFHNQFRNNVASGLLTNPSPDTYPPATNMRKMSWDDELAKMAQAWVNQCKYEHDTNRDVSRFHVGQSIYETPTYDTQVRARNIFRAAMMSWIGRDILLNTSVVNSFPATYPLPIGSVVQMVWADTHKIGCGISMYVSDEPDPRTNSFYNVLLVACNYGPAGNLPGQSAYQVGTPASNCPPGTTAIGYLCV